jgi:hypothetical protein
MNDKAPFSAETGRHTWAQILSLLCIGLISDAAKLDD